MEPDYFKPLLGLNGSYFRINQIENLVLQMKGTEHAIQKCGINTLRMMTKNEFILAKLRQFSVTNQSAPALPYCAHAGIRKLQR